MFLFNDEFLNGEYLKVDVDPSRISGFHNHEAFHFPICKSWPHLGKKETGAQSLK